MIRFLSKQPLPIKRRPVSSQRWCAEVHGGNQRRIPVAHLEGLVALGLIKRYWWRECDVPNMVKFFVETSNGEIYETKCIDARGAKKVITYLGISSRLSRDLVLDIEVDKEEVFVPEEK